MDGFRSAREFQLTQKAQRFSFYRQNHPAMNVLRTLSRATPRLIAVAVASSAIAQLVTVDVSSPTDPYISYDEDPYQYSPPISENPTVIYPAGAGTGSTAYTTDPATSQQPRVVTSDAPPPDSYTLN